MHPCMLLPAMLHPRECMGERKREIRGRPRASCGSMSSGRGRAHSDVERIGRVSPHTGEREKAHERLRVEQSAAAVCLTANREKDSEVTGGCGECTARRRTRERERERQLARQGRNE